MAVVQRAVTDVQLVYFPTTHFLSSLIDTELSHLSYLLCLNSIEHDSAVFAVAALVDGKKIKAYNIFYESLLGGLCADSAGAAHVAWH